MGVIPYDAPVDTDKVEVTLPAYDFVPPDMCNLCNNNGVIALIHVPIAG